MNDVERAERLLRERAHGRVERDAPVGPLTSYGLGGSAAVFLEAEGDQDLAALGDALRETGVPLLVIGRGSNMLVSDRGFPGIAVRLGAGFRWTRVEGERIEAGASVPLPSLAVLSGRESLAGLEFAVAIPASVGGAVRMNAGAHGRSVGEVLDRVDVFRLDAGIREQIPASSLGFSYRSSDLPADALVVAAGFGLERGDQEEIQAKLRESREWRRATQPLNLPNAGSVFKNPPDDAAGRLIEQVLGKGVSVGGARISEVHANFIVASPGATADHVFSLIRVIQRKVKDDTGVDLEPEVRLVGDFEEVGDGASTR